ncbi:MAG: 30S ribosome-binding factor RbfA [Tissierellia bacterium]|nr:30S ribosome-binding factor RbfA [Tissierellia bacterium]
MNPRRVQRISEEIRKEISSIIQNDIKDPRMPDMISVPRVEVTRDLSYARIMISILGSDKQKEDALEGLNNAKGFIKKELGRAIRLPSMPELIFELDESIEKNIEFEQLIESLKDGDGQNG